MFTLPDLSYPASALEPYIDTATMELHHNKHHAAYVKNLNDALPDKNEKDLESILRHLDQLPQDIRTKVRNNGGGHYNHTLFWQIMAPAAGQQPPEKLLAAITSAFSSFDVFKEKFTAVAMGRFGSGWAWLSLTPDGKLMLEDSPNQDLPAGAGKPILGLDVWEHAYYLKYQNRRAEYIAGWWNVVNWKQVAINLEGR